MCGIVGAIANHSVENILLEGLRRLEYRGYDSAGIAVIDSSGRLQRLRCKGKIRALEAQLENSPLSGNCGIAHTRWATHGAPAEHNAHPFVSQDEFAIVHNGIIENHAPLRKKLVDAGYDFTSDTDSEVIAHLLDFYFQQTHDLLTSTQKTVAELEGAYAIAILSKSHPETLMAVRHGSPLVLGLGQHENFLASDPLALLTVTRQFVYLEEGDIAEISREKIQVYTEKGKKIARKIHDLAAQADADLSDEHRHYMQQEIFSQPDAFRACLAAARDKKYSQTVFARVSHIQLIACGTSFHAALVTRYWMETLTGLPVTVETASEYRYRDPVILPDSLTIVISQSGETADTLAAAQLVKKSGRSHLIAICNVAESSLMRIADAGFLTHAGAEIGVASTKAFTTQLVVLLFLTLTLKHQYLPDAEAEKSIQTALQFLPAFAEKTLLLNDAIETLARQFVDDTHALFIGRNTLYPIALEGALKLKEISYIHAEGYPAGELKHGPLALVDKNMPVIALAPDNILFAKMCGSLSEVRARGGRLYVFTDNKPAIRAMDKNIEIIELPAVHPALTPIIYTLPMQLLAYHVAVLKGTDVDQPRNLAKSVTVE